MIKDISSIMWIITTLMITITSIIMFFYLNFPHSKQSKTVNKYDKNDIKETIKVLSLTLASKIGVGSISGIALAILIGGKGSIFWIWVSSIFLSQITALETKLGTKFKIKKGPDIIGGPQVYINKELNKKNLSKTYSVLIIFTYLFAFILIQSKAIIKSINSSFNINSSTITIILIILVYLSIKKGISSISKITTFLVPIMSLIYIIIGLIIIIRYHYLLPTIIKEILSESFKFKTLISLPIIVGFERAIFSTEAGIGTTSMITALSNTNNCKKETRIQIIGILFITLIVCSISALIILTTNYTNLKIINNNEIELINYAFSFHFGRAGIYILSILVFFFSFSTIITSYYYGDINIKNLLNNKNNTTVKIIVIIVIVLSNFLKSEEIWAILDIVTSLTTLINLYSIYKLRKALKE